jgi:hypothetical protein
MFASNFQLISLHDHQLNEPLKPLPRRNQQNIMPLYHKRVFSFSSTETILEADSPTPSPTSESGPADHAGVSRSQLPAGGAITPLSRESRASRSSRHPKRDCDGNIKVSGVKDKQQIPDGAAEDDEESINWDEESETEEERWYHEHREIRVGPRWSTLPQTIGFWFDWCLGEIATEAVDVCPSLSYSYSARNAHKDTA